MRILVLLLIFGLSVSLQAQERDTIVQKRTARKFVREGNELYKEKKYADAAVSYKKSLDQVGGYYKAAQNLGNAFMQQKNAKEAIPQFELAAKGGNTKVEKAAAYHNLGNALMQQKEFEKAVEAFKNSLRNNPSDDESRYNLAHAQQMLKKKEEQDKKDNKPPPSEYAKRMKKKADALLSKFKFKEALELLDAALKKDITVSNYNDYMKRLETITKIEE